MNADSELGKIGAFPTQHRLARRGPLTKAMTIVSVCPLAGRRGFFNLRSSAQSLSYYSIKVTLLISFSVEIPANAFCSADSRRKVIPSS